MEKNSAVSWHLLWPFGSMSYWFFCSYIQCYLFDPLRLGAVFSSFEEARVGAQQIAQQYADVSQVDDFAIYNGTETYYSLKGKDKNGDEVYVLIPSSSSSIYVYPVGAGITKEEAQAIAQENGAKTADRTILGYRDGKPIWEVKSGTAYYLVDFETGDFVKMEGL